MKEHPIIFTKPMVQAILAGRKTMTRRIVKGIPHEQIVKVEQQTDLLWEFDNELHDLKMWTIKCPYGKIGDRLWVRETWQHTRCININPEDENYGYVYKSDGQPWDDYIGWTWKPSIHMPRLASRIILEITNIRVEKLQDITKLEAINEGIEIVDTIPVIQYKDYEVANGIFCNPKNSFNSLWNTIHGKDSWNLNPWVWIIVFKKI
jgi:hypothetical protein